MRFNRDKFNDFAREFGAQAVETDERVYRLYLKAQLVADMFWAYAWMLFRAVCRFCWRRPQVIGLIGLVYFSERIVDEMLNGRFDVAPAATILIVNAVAIGVIISGLLLPSSTRDPGVEFAQRN